MAMALSCSRICAASSRVGVTTSARVVRRGFPSRRCRIGSRNAAVLPLPVAAHASRSRPSSAGGMASAWIGVGRTKPSSFRPIWSDLSSCSVVNAITDPSAKCKQGGGRSVTGPRVEIQELKHNPLPSLRGASAASDEAIPMHRAEPLDGRDGSVPMHRDCFVARCARSSQ